MKILILLALIVAVSCQSLPSSFQGTDLAMKFWKFCVTSYCDPDRINNWNCGEMCQEQPNFESISVFINSSSDIQAFTGYNPDDDTIYVVFRGSFVYLQNWISDLETEYQKFQYPHCTGCEVHHGFYNAYLSVSNDLISQVQNLRASHPTSNLAVLGHSLGASMSTFAAIDLHLLGLNVNYFYNYGCPRVGNPNFANWLNGLNIGFKARIVHDKDIVPHLPPESFGFQHYNYEVFYNSDSNLNYQNCPVTEDPSCSDQFSFLQFSIADHLNYMLDSVVPLAIKCGFKYPQNSTSFFQ